MKRIYYLLMVASGLFFLSQHSLAQKDSGGIYTTTEDFQQRKLSYAINCKTEKHKINPNVFFKGSEVKVFSRVSFLKIISEIGECGEVIL